MSEQPDALSGLKAYPEAYYANLDLTGLVAFAISRLQALNTPTTFENVVVAVFRFFPAKFHLVGFTAYPDAARVGRTLLQLGPKYRNWARGSVQKGFSLTAEGQAKVASVARALSGVSPPSIEPIAEKVRPRTMDLSKELKVIEESALFRQWHAGDLVKAGAVDFFDMLGAYAYTPGRVLRDRIRTLETIAREYKRDDLLVFLGAVRKEFAEQLRG